MYITMRKLFTLVALLVVVMVSSCAYDDTSLWSAITDLQNRMKAVEELCKETNTNLDALQELVSAISDNEQIKSIVPIEKDGNIIGYTLTFTNGESVTIYNEKNDNDAGVVPQIGVAQDSDNIYYWTLDGEWLLDAYGNKIKAQGEDGLTPKFKIEEEYWYISYDNGTTWDSVGKVVPGEVIDCNCQGIFQSVDFDDEYVYFTLADGSVIVVPKATTDSASLNHIKLILPPNNEVWYTSTTGDIIELNYYPYTLVSNTYENGIGKYTFAEDVVEVGNYFGQDVNGKMVHQFTSLIFPSTVTNHSTYHSLSGLLNADMLVFSKNLKSIGVDFIGSIGDSLEEKHIYFISDTCPSTSWMAFWNTSSKLYVHYPAGADYSDMESALSNWKDDYSPFRYEMVETTYELIYSNDNTYQEPEAIDLGLSVLWASYNVGANRPEEFGDYFAWGEITAKSEYTDDNYVGEYDGDIVGNPEHDAATANWGEEWRMPSREEQIELIDNCEWEWTTVNDVNGMLITGPNGNSIFLPAAGYIINTTPVYLDSFGYYWSATKYGYWSEEYCKYFCHDGSYASTEVKQYNGLSIRPVKEK